MQFLFNILGVEQICLNDKLIKVFGMHQLERLGSLRPVDINNIRTKLRVLGRLVKRLQERLNSREGLDKLITPEHFDSFIEIG